MTTNWLDDYFGPALVQDEGSDLPKRGALAFVGPAITATDDPTNKRTVVTVAVNTLAPDGTGNANITGEVNNTSNPKVKRHEYNINTVNGVATAVAVLTIPTSAGKSYTVRGIVALLNAAANAYGEFEINCFVVNAAGVLTLVGAAPVTAKANVTGYTVAVAVSGTNILINVTDPGAPGLVRRITGEIYVAERSF